MDEAGKIFPPRETGRGDREDRTDSKADSSWVALGGRAHSFPGTFLLSALWYPHVALAVKGLNEGEAGTVKVSAFTWQLVSQTVLAHGLWSAQHCKHDLGPTFQHT